MSGLWQGVTKIYAMKISSLLIDRIAFGVTLATVVSCSGENVVTEKQTASDTLKSFVESTDDTTKECLAPENTLIIDSLSGNDSIENTIPKITRDNCPNCGMG